MPDLGPHLSTVLAAYAVAFGCLAALIAASLISAARTKNRLKDIDERQTRD